MMKSIFDIPRLQQFGLLLSALAIGASVYLRSTSRPHQERSDWNRFDRNAPMFDMADGSFPASDPPSTVPAA
jgi:hypothetical protein